MKISHKLFAILTMVVLVAILLTSPAGAETISVPMDIDGVRIFVVVLVNDKRARLLLDTGAGITLVEPQFAKGTRELQSVFTQQLAGFSQASIRRVSLTLGELTLKDVLVGVLDMTDVKKRAAMDMNGMLGEDVLCRFRSVRINFKNKTLELER
ncbi:MAG TPA: aspartyl protease family protein [Candidatus Saccharimonadales bacterium]|nr:aspartyl protease family protein [Candidatus Saccharimonadales bacterium]